MNGCPSLKAIERAFPSAADSTLLAHLGTCQRCSEQWHRLAQIARLADAAPLPPLSAARRIAIRDTVLVRATDGRPLASSWQLPRLSLANLFLALIAATYFFSDPPQTDVPAASRGAPSSAASAISPITLTSTRRLTAHEPVASLPNRYSRMQQTVRHEESPSPQELRYQSAWSALRSNDFNRAVFAFEEAEALGLQNPLAADSAYWRAIALARLDSEAEAIAALRHFLHTYPENRRVEEASVMLGWLFLKYGNATAAKDRFLLAAESTVPMVRHSADEGLLALDELPRTN